MRASAAALLFAAALAAMRPGTATAQTRPTQADRTTPEPVVSLCRAPEAVLFTCRVGTRTVSICGWLEDQGGVVYRYGRPGRIELETTDLHRAFEGWPGGGETQVYADTPTHRYVVYDRMVRIGYDREGHNIPKMTQGLLVQSHGQTAWQRQCAPPRTYDPHTLPEAAFDQRLIEKLIPEGEYVDH